MKKILFILTLAAVSLTSCLKDSPNTNFSSIGTVVELPFAGLQYFGSDAVTNTADTVNLAFGINIASAKALSTPTNYTLSVDYALMNAYNTKNNTNYLQMPTGSYKISKLSGTIAAGNRLDSVKVTIYRTFLDPSKSYMLPIALTGASNGILSGNFNAHYYHFIGNDFAGAWRQTWRRWTAQTDSVSGGFSGSSFAGQPTTFIPLSSSEFVVFTGYNGGNTIRYDVTFTKVGPDNYQNFNVTLLASDVAAYVGAISFPQMPQFEASPGTIGLGNNRPGPFTYAQAVKIFNFQYIAFSVGAGAPRYMVDYFYK